MMKAFLNFFKAPVFSDDKEATRSAYYLNAVTLVSLPVILGFILTRFALGTATLSATTLTPFVFLGALLASFVLMKLRYIRAASYLYLIGMWIAISALIASGNSSSGVGAARYFVVIAFAGLVLGYRVAIGVAAISILSVFMFSYAEMLGFLQQRAEPPMEIAAQIAGQLILGTAFVYLDVKNLQETARQNEEKHRALEKNNREMLAIHSQLEQRAQEHAEELVKANAENKRRAAQFQTVSQIAQKIASERDVEKLLSVITEVISAQFGYHHTAIYLNDDLQEYVVLNAASDDIGRQMIENNYKLHLDAQTVVSYVSKTGSERLITDARLEESSLWKPVHAGMLSELTLPLKIGEQTIGALDMQSKTANAFDPTDIEALTALASQTVTAIQNARLSAQTETSLAESQLLYGTMVKQTWNANQRQSPRIGYRYRGIKPVELEHEIYNPEIVNALENGDIAVTHASKRKTENALAVPLKLRDSTIGVIHVNLPVEEEFGEDEIEILRAASERVAIALENASLLEESQRRARREQVIGEMSAKISSGTDIETILKTALRELGGHIGGAQIIVELEKEEESR